MTEKIKRSKDYIESHSTKKGQPFKKLSKRQLSAYQRNKVDIEYLEDYYTRLNHIKAAPKYMGEGIYTHKKKKRL